jgi:hypothetical protein
MVPWVERRRQARRGPRALPSQRRGRFLGAQSGPLAADGAANRGAADNIEYEARLQLLRHRPRNDSVEAQVPLRLRHPPAPLVRRALLPAA